jgi:hypothetical protein
MIRAQLWNLILKFNLISCGANYSEFNIYPTLSLEITKPRPWNPASHELSKSTKSLTKFFFKNNCLWNFLENIVQYSISLVL